MKIKTSKSFYTPAEIQEYLLHIGFFPSASEASSLESIVPDLPTLTKIVRQHIVAFPFENLTIHYTKEGIVDVSPAGAFKRMVQSKKGLGSFCFGQNTLLLGVLKGLGFRVTAGAARVNGTIDSSKLAPQVHNHMILFVQLPSPSLENCNSEPDQIYLIDVGFGGIFGLSGPMRPIPLIPSLSHPGSAPPEEHRLEIGSHPNSVQENDEYWLLQARCGRPEWTTLYLFQLQEFFPADFTEYSLRECNAIGGLMSSVVIVVKFASLEKENDDKENDSLQRYIVAGNKYLKRMGDQVEVLKVFRNEEERLEAITSSECGIIFDGREEALSCIAGRVSRLQDVNIPSNST